MLRAFTIALNTIREIIRDRIFITLLIFALLVIGFSYVLGNLAGLEKGKVIKDLGLSSIHVFGALISILISINLLRKEIDEKTIHTVIIRPVSRPMFFFGKYIGFLAMLLMAISLMFVFFVVVLRISAVPIGSQLVVAASFIFLELTLLSALSLMFSSFFPAWISAIATIAIFVIGHFTESIKYFGSQSETVVMRVCSQVFYWVLPNLENFNFKAQAAYDLSIPVFEAIPALIIGLCYTGILLIVGVVLFSRHRDFS